jgi:hypothetical protein
MQYKEILVYGASDDLVEFEGAINEEFDCYGDWFGVLSAPNGDKLNLRLSFGKFGWLIQVSASSDDGYPEWLMHFTERPDREGDPALSILAPEGTTVTEVN